MMVSSLGGGMLSDSPCAKTARTTGHPSRCLSVSEVLLQSLHLVCVVVSSPYALSCFRRTSLLLRICLQ